MLDRLIAAVTDLPVIVQGALGSALFALLLFLGQKCTASVGTWYSNSSKRRKKEALVDELAVLSVVVAKDIPRSTHFTVMVLYRASRHLVRALYWLALGLIFGSTISVFGIVGYLGCLFFLLQALRLVQGRSEEELNAAESRLEEIKVELGIKTDNPAQ
jgi:hypothetical protein